MDKAEDGTYSTKMFEEFKQKHYINEYGTVNMAEISSSTMETGNGDEDTGDIYKIKRADDSTGYYLFYYDENNNERNLGKLFEEKLSLEEIIAKEDGDCMIDEYGNIMPITTWTYEIIQDGTCRLTGTANGSFGGFSNYNGGVDEGGELIFKIPVLIKKAGLTRRVSCLGIGSVASIPGLKKLRIPDGVTPEEKACMAYRDENRELEFVNVGAVDGIGKGCFAFCKALKRVVINEGAKWLRHWLLPRVQCPQRHQASRLAGVYWFVLLRRLHTN